MADEVAKAKKRIREQVERESVYQRRQAWVAKPKPDEFIAARADFADRWEALVAEGEEHGYFDRSVEGYEVDTDTMDRTLEFAETPEEHRKRVAAEVNRRWKSVLAGISATYGSGR